MNYMFQCKHQLYQQSVGDGPTLARWNILTYCQTLPAGSPIGRIMHG